MTQHVRWFGASIAAAILIADLSSKAAMVSFLTGSGDRVELLPFLDLRLGYNRGISFGLLGSYGDWMPWVLALVAFLPIWQRFYGAPQISVMQSGSD